MKKYFVILLLIFSGFLFPAMAISSDPCDEYKKTFGKNNQILNELNSIINYGPGDVSSAGFYMSSKQYDVINEFIDLIFESKYYKCGIAKITEVINEFDRAEYHFPLYLVRASFYEGICKYKEASQDYEAMMQNAEYIHSESIKHEGFCNYAFFLATVPNEKFRDGKKASDIVDKALQIKKDFISYQSMAAVYAELGDFKSAIVYQNLAIKNYSTKKDHTIPISDSKNSLSAYTKQLESYEQKKPWRVKCR